MSPSELPREILVSGDRDSDRQYHGDGDGNDDGFPVTGGGQAVCTPHNSCKRDTDTNISRRKPYNFVSRAAWFDSWWPVSDTEHAIIVEDDLVGVVDSPQYSV